MIINNLDHFYLSFICFVLYDISVSTVCIYRDYCVYHYKSTELLSLLYTLDILMDFKSIFLLIFI